MRALVHAAFTLVELMTVVAIVAVLAAIAVPLVNNFQMRAKRAEAEPIVADLRVAQIGYHAARDVYASSNSLEPDSNPGKTLRNWTPGSAYSLIGFRPDGAVRGSYRMPAESGTLCTLPGPLVYVCQVGKTICFGGITDIDQDNKTACWVGSIGDAVVAQTNDATY